MRHCPILAALILFSWASTGVAQADEKFEHAAVRFEQNATDADVEVVFEATSSGEAGLAALKVIAPDGRTVIDFTAPSSKLGIRSVTFESPEPKNDGTLQADFPAGQYTFMGSTVAGVKLTSKATLSHALPGLAVFAHPRPDQENVAAKGLQISWKAAKNVASCVLVLEHEETGVKILEAQLPSSATRFAVPAGLLVPGTTYKSALTTVGREGNTSTVEATFTTADKK
jgi:hypothetical protein